MVQQNKPQPVVFWAIWAALFVALFVYQFALGGGVPRGSNGSEVGFSLPVALAVVQVAAASFIRWLLIPKKTAAGQLLVLMIFGLALSEAVEFYGLFLVPADQPTTKLALWVLALVSEFQFMPVYAHGKKA